MIDVGQKEAFYQQQLHDLVEYGGIPLAVASVGIRQGMKIVEDMYAVCKPSENDSEETQIIAVLIRDMVLSSWIDKHKKDLGLGLGLIAAKNGKLDVFVNNIFGEEK
jgi:hypothetical protein